MRQYGDKSHREVYVKIREWIHEEGKSRDTVGSFWFKLMLQQRTISLIDTCVIFLSHSSFFTKDIQSISYLPIYVVDFF